MLKFFSFYEDPLILIKEIDYARSRNGTQFRVPFNSSKKYSLAVIKDCDGSIENGFFTVFIKGSSEVISLNIEYRLFGQCVHICTEIIN